MYPRWEHLRVFPFDTRLTPLPIPSAGVFSSPTRTVCVNVEWAGHILGVLDRLAWEDAWTGTDEEIQAAIQGVYSLMVAFSEGCCGDDVADITDWRLSATGEVEVSRDGGATWEVSPENDPRQTTALFPPLPTGVSDTTRCAAADNATEAIHTIITNMSNALEVGAVIGGALLEGIVLYMSAGILAAFATPLIAGVTLAGGAALSAAFTTEVYDSLKCCLFCNFTTSGTLTNKQALLDCIDDEIMGLANTVLHLVIELTFPNGLVNMGRTGSAAGDDCDDCDCPCETATSFETYVANEANTDYTIGQYVVDGACDGRAFGTGWATNNVRFIIPDRAGRKVMQVQPNYCDSSGLPLDVEVQAGTIDSDQGSIEAHGAPVYTFSTPIDDDQIDVFMTTPAQGSLILHHLVIWYCE